MLKMGERIKRRREFLEIHLNEMAKRIGVSSSLLSQIENGKAFPSVFNLKKIADSLGTSISEIIGENEMLGQHPVVRYNERKFVKKATSGAYLYLLSGYSSVQQMGAYYIRLPRGATTEGLLESHRGHEFCFVLDGAIEAWHSDERFTLQKGDTIYFNANRTSEIKNMIDGVSELLWVITPNI